MVKRKCYLVVSIIFNVVSLLLFLLLDSRHYSYPKFSLQFKQLVLLILMHGIIVGVEILVFLLMFKFKKLAFIRVLSTILLIIVAFYSVVFLYIGLIGQMWSSKINEYDDFHGLDSHMSVVNCPGISLNDIVYGDVIHAENFYYSSSLLFFTVDFEIRGDFYYSKEHYEKVKNQFLCAPEFDIVIYDDTESANDLTGAFVLNVEYGDSHTDFKYRAYKEGNISVKFSDTLHMFSFSFSGSVRH